MKFQDDISMAHTVLDLFVASSAVVYRMPFRRTPNGLPSKNEAGFYRVEFFTLGDWFVLNFDFIF